MKKHFIIALFYSFLTLGLFFSIQSLFAWTNPTLSPPLTNISPAINEGTTTQVKDGSLGITGNLTAPILYDSNNTGYYIDPAGTSVLNSTTLNGKINSAGAESTYGSLTINGTKNGWAGINFKSGSTNYGTLMVHPDYQGFYNNGDSGWDWYWANGVLSAGSVPWARITGAPSTQSVSCNWVGWQMPVPTSECSITSYWHEGRPCNGCPNCSDYNCVANSWSALNFYCSSGIISQVNTQSTTYYTCKYVPFVGF